MPIRPANGHDGVNGSELVEGDRDRPTAQVVETRPWASKKHVLTLPAAPTARSRAQSAGLTWPPPEERRLVVHLADADEGELARSGGLQSRLDDPVAQEGRSRGLGFDDGRRVEIVDS